MDAHQENDVNQDIVSPEVPEADVSEQVEQTQEPVSPREEDPQEKNWREARQALKELRRQNEELRQHITQLSQPKEEDPEEELAEDDWVTVKGLKKTISDLEERFHKRESENVIERLRGKYSDFDDVVSEENIAYLKQHDPELAESIEHLKHDPYRQGIAAYKMLKKTDYYLNRNSMQDKAKAIENGKKPVSVNAVKKAGALSEANKFDRGLTPELRKQLWQEMQEVRKRA